MPNPPCVFISEGRERARDTDEKRRGKREEKKEGGRGIEERGREYKLPNNQHLHFRIRDPMLLIKASINFRDRFPDEGVISEHCHTRRLEF